MPNINTPAPTRLPSPTSTPASQGLAEPQSKHRHGLTSALRLATFAVLICPRLPAAPRRSGSSFPWLPLSSRH